MGTNFETVASIVLGIIALLQSYQTYTNTKLVQVINTLKEKLNHMELNFVRLEARTVSQDQIERVKNDINFIKTDLLLIKERQLKGESRE